MRGNSLERQAGLALRLLMSLKGSNGWLRSLGQTLSGDGDFVQCLFYHMIWGESIQFGVGG